MNTKAIPEDNERLRDRALLRPPEAARYIGVSLRHLYNIAETDPNFPRKVHLTTRCVGYRREALDRWSEQKEAGE